MQAVFGGIYVGKAAAMTMEASHGEPSHSPGQAAQPHLEDSGTIAINRFLIIIRRQINANTVAVFPNLKIDYEVDSGGTINQIEASLNVKEGFHPLSDCFGQVGFITRILANRNEAPSSLLHN